VLPEIHNLMIWRDILGTFVVVGAYVQFYNILMSLKAAKPDREVREPVIGVEDEQALLALASTNGHGRITGGSQE